MTSNKANIRNKIILAVLGFTATILIIAITCYFVTKRKYQSLNDFMREVEVRAIVRPGRPSAVTNIILLDPAE